MINRKKPVNINFNKLNLIKSIERKYSFSEKKFIPTYSFSDWKIKTIGRKTSMC